MFDSRPRWSIMAKPPAWQRSAMHRHPSACSKRASELLHLTALGLGPRDDLECEVETLVEALRTVEAEPVLLRLDRAEAKKGSRHTELVSSKPPKSAQRLRMALWNALQRRGISLPLPPRIRPHVTLNYRWQGDAFRDSIEPISWLIDELLLIESITGETRHVTHARFPIRPRQGTLFPLTRCSADPRDPGGGTLVSPCR